MMVIVSLAAAVLLAACGGQSATSESPASETVPTAFSDPEAAFADREASGEDLIYAWFGVLAEDAPRGEHEGGHLEGTLAAHEALDVHDRGA